MHRLELIRIWWYIITILDIISTMVNKILLVGILVPTYCNYEKTYTAIIEFSYPTNMLLLYYRYFSLIDI